MECVAVLTTMSVIIFVRLAMIQDLNPFLWGFLAFLVYFGPPAWLIWRGADFMDAPLVWISSFAGLVLLFIVQAVVANWKRYRER